MRKRQYVQYAQNTALKNKKIYILTKNKKRGNMLAID